MIIKDITDYLEELSPLDYSLNWDNCGLQVGNKLNKVKNIGIALTPTTEIIEKAIENNCNFLITHHPSIFKKNRYF
jgi:putative NIF3 family GTP cyclohydrolase 1 type 2